MADKKELQSILEKSGLSPKDAAQAVKSIQAMMGDRPKASSPEEIKKQVAQAEADLKLKKEKLELEENIMNAVGEQYSKQQVLTHIGQEQLEIEKLKMDLLLSSKDATAKELQDQKAKIIEQVKYNKALAKGQEIFAAIEGASANLAQNIGFAQKGFGSLVDDATLSAKGFKDLSKSSGQLLKNVLKSFTPMKLFGGFVNAAVESFMSLDKAQNNLFQSTGMADMAPRMAKIANESQSLSMRGPELANAFAAMQTEIQGFYNLNTTNQDTILNTVATLEQFGVSATSTGEAIGFLTTSMGMSLPASEETARELASLAQQLKLPPDMIISGFNGASKELAKYGPRMVGEFKRIQGASQLLNMDVGSMLQSMAQFDTFDTAAKSAGNLNALLGGPYMDSIELLSATESERLVLLKEGLEMSGKSFDQLDKFKKAAIAKEMGMSVTQLGKMMAKSSDQIRAAMADADTQAETAANMQKERVRMMDVMTRLGLELEKAMTAAFGNDLFSDETMKNIKGVFEGIFGLVKGIAKVMGTVSGAITSITGSPIMGVLGLGGAAVIGTLAVKAVMGAVMGRLMPGGTPINPSYVVPLGGGMGGMGGGGPGGGPRGGPGGGRPGRFSGSRFQGGGSPRPGRFSGSRFQGGKLPGGLGNSIKGLGNSIKGLGGKIGPLIATIGSLGTSIAGSLAPAVRKAGEVGLNAAKGASGSVVGAAGKAGGTLKKVGLTAVNSVGGATGKAGGALKKAGSSLLGKASGLFNFGALSDMASSAGNRIAGGAKSLGTSAMNMASSAGNRIASGAKSLGTGAMSMAKDAGGYVKSKAGQAGSFIAEKSGKAGAFVAKHAGALKDKAMNSSLGKLLSSIDKGKGLKIFKKIGKLPLVGMLIETIMAGNNIKGLIESGERGADLHQQVGSQVLSSIGGVAGGALATAALNTVTAGAGVAGSLLAYMGGDFLGRTLGGYMAENLPGLAVPIGRSVSETFFGDNLKTPTPKQPQAMNDAYISSPSGGSARFNSSDGFEAVASKEGGVLAKKLDKLIDIMSNNTGDQRDVVINVDRREIARAAINGINKDFYNLSTV